MNGFLVVDKPKGLTSHDVVARIRKLLAEKSVGHLGTLDPIATGVLPLLLGKYTRLAPFFDQSEKSYEGELRFGIATSTYDREGDPLPGASGASVASLQEETVTQVIAADLVGDIDQMPPPYSAKKISGVPAYKKARRGETVTLPTKRVHVSSFEVFDLDEAGIACFHCKVSAGTYVRSLVHDLGQKLGCGAHVLELRRTVSGEFMLDKAWTLEQLERWDHNGETAPWLNIHPREVLQHIPCVTAPPEAMAKIRHGNPVNLPVFGGKSKLVKVFENQINLVAIAQRIAGTLFQPKVVLI